MIIKQLMRPELRDDYGILKLQNIILNIMMYIHELCEKYNIGYYIIGGTALGAARHGGFIPWDDDLDIAMTRDNYNKFLEVCEKELNCKEFFLQVGRRDWLLYFSKLRLKGTLFDEIGAGEEIAKENRGIFIDIFPLDVASNNKCLRIWQFVCSKLLIAQAVSCRHYQTNSIVKRMLMWLSYPLKYNRIQRFFYNQVTRFNGKDTDFIGDFFGITKLKEASYPKELWGRSQKVAFERVSLCAPENNLDYLGFHYGDYMKLPPAEKRVCCHHNGIDFGVYS